MVCVGCGDAFDAEQLGFAGVDLTNVRCPICRKDLRDKLDKQKADELQIDTARRRRLFRRTCGIPRKYMNEEFGTFDETKQQVAYKKCLEYAQNFKIKKPDMVSLIMLSPGINGVGKTHLACGIVHNILNRWQGETTNCPVHFVTEPDLFSRIRATYNKREFLEAVMAETEQDVINYYKTVPLLVVDDVAKEEVGDPKFVQRIWFRIINGRYNNMLPVVITTNKNIDELSWHFSGGAGNEAVDDRLGEMSGGEYVLLEGDSYRPIKGRGKEN